MHVGRPGLLNRELFLSRVNTILDNAVFTNNGPFVQELEVYVCKQLHVSHCIAVANATLGLELLLAALELQGEVIVPAFTFISTAQAILRTGLKPVFCDIDPQEQGSVSAQSVRKHITEKTSAILAVNLYGYAADVDGLSKLAAEHNLKLVFDSAHALGVKVNGKFAGGFGDAEVFSLHATKFIQGCEGGLITTNNAELAHRLTLLRNFGFNGYDNVEMLGTNAKLSELHAAMALTSMEMMSTIKELNWRNFQAYKRHLPAPIELLEPKSCIESNYQYVVALAPPAIREKIVERMHARNILVRKYFYPGVHKHPPFNAVKLDLPATDALAQRVICLPTGPSVSEDDIKLVCQALSDSMSECVSGSTCES